MYKMDAMLISQVKKVLSDSFLMYFKAHTYHWNVVGSNFPQYHTLFGEVYEDVYGSIDTTAEIIRALDGTPAISLMNIVNMSSISEDDDVVSPMSMVSRLIDANNIVLAALFSAYQSAEEATEIGVANYLQDRILAHQKLGWKLKSTAK